MATFCRRCDICDTVLVPVLGLHQGSCQATNVKRSVCDFWLGEVKSNDRLMKGTPSWLQKAGLTEGWSKCEFDTKALRIKHAAWRFNIISFCRGKVVAWEDARLLEQSVRSLASCRIQTSMPLQDHLVPPVAQKLREETCLHLVGFARYCVKKW